MCEIKWINDRGVLARYIVAICVVFPSKAGMRKVREL